MEPESRLSQNPIEKIRGQAQKLPMGQINLRLPMNIYNAIQAQSQKEFRSLKSQCELKLCEYGASLLEPPPETEEAYVEDDLDAND